MTDQPTERLSLVLRIAREALGFTLRDMPRKMPVSVVRWGEFERGVSVPTIWELDDIARALGLDYGRLLQLRSGSPAGLEDLVMQAGRILHPDARDLPELAARLLLSATADCETVSARLAPILIQLRQRVVAAEHARDVDAMLHPAGRCTCPGEGECRWCTRASDSQPPQR